jgi:hypothetical protein
MGYELEAFGIRKAYDGLNGLLMHLQSAGHFEWS